MTHVRLVHTLTDRWVAFLRTDTVALTDGVEWLTSEPTKGLKDAKVISAFDAGLLFFMHNDHARILTIGVNPPLLSLSLKSMDHAQDRIRQHLFELAEFCQNTGGKLNAPPSYQQFESAASNESSPQILAAESQTSTVSTVGDEGESQPAAQESQSSVTSTRSTPMTSPALSQQTPHFSFSSQQSTASLGSMRSLKRHTKPPVPVMKRRKGFGLVDPRYRVTDRSESLFEESDNDEQEEDKQASSNSTAPSSSKKAH